MPTKASSPRPKRPARAPSKRAAPKRRSRLIVPGDAEALAANIGFEPRRIELLRQALVHKSAEQELNLPANERLEFLGDAILGLAVAGHLYRSHPEMTEGPLTKVKAVAVSEPVLAAVAREIDLGRYLVLARGEERNGGRDRPSILADALEAVFAAVYLDRGFRTCRALILRLLAEHLDAIERDEYESDHKTLLQEYVQERHHTPPTYRVISETGPDHDRTFVTEVRVGRRTLGSGSGKSKKQAEQAAAREALKHC